eukprot:4555139-Prymnesium_polylepis.1
MAGPDGGSWVWQRRADTARGAGSRLMPDIEPQSRSDVHFFVAKCALGVRGEQGRNRLVYESDEVCGSFCGCLSIPALAADRAAKEKSQSPPHDLLKPL